MQSKRADVRIIDSETLSDSWYNLKNTPSTCSAVTVNGNDSNERSTTVATARLFFSTTVRKTVILTRQFRFPVFINGHEDDLIEAAAGLLDNMDPESRIKAEAEEETGFQVSSVQKIFEAYMSPGSVTENSIFILPSISRKTEPAKAAGSRLREKISTCWK